MERRAPRPDLLKEKLDLLQMFLLEKPDIIVILSADGHCIKVGSSSDLRSDA